MEIHPYADCFPMLSEAELMTLTDDIKHNGQVQPIIIDQHDRIVDGRNRYQACKSLGIAVEYEVRKLTDDEALHLVGSLNLHRRHMTPTQRAAVGAKLANLKNGERADLKRQAISQEIASPKPVSIEEAAKATGASVASIRRRKKIERDGVPELVTAVDEGVVDMAVAADAISNMEPSEQKKAIADIRLGKASKKDIRESAPRYKDEPEPEERNSKGVGIRYAHDAIAALKRIPPNDALRASAFKLVADYIKHNK